MKKIIIISVYLVIVNNLPAQPFTKVLQPGDSLLGFLQLAEKINSYYDTAKGSNRSMYKQWKRWEWFASHHLDQNGNLADYTRKNSEYMQQLSRNTQLNTTNITNSNSGAWFNVGHSDYVNSDNMALQGRANCFAFDPVNASVIYAGTAGGGIWKSTNAGFDWYNISDNLPVTSISGLAVAASNGNTIYALTGEGNLGIGNAYHSSGIGVIKSYDGGSTWEQTGLQYQISQLTGGYKLRLHPGNDNIVYAATRVGLYRSLDAGYSWQIILTGDINDFEFKPDNTNLLYCATMSSSVLSILDLTNLSVTYSVLNSTFPVSRMEIAVTPDNPNAVYLLAGPNYLNGGAGTPNGTAMYNGLYYSGNAGQTFTLRNNNVDLFAVGDQSRYDNIIFVHPFNENVVIIGGVRLYRSTDGGSTLTTELNTPQDIHGDNHGIERNPLNGNIYLGTDGGIYRSTNDGVDWNKMSSNLTINEYYRISGIQNNEQLILGGTQDNGLFLRTSNTDVYLSAIEGLDFMDNIIDFTNPNIIYACNQNGGLWRSTNGGSGFTALATPAPGGWITPIIQLPDPANPNTIFYASNVGVLRSTDQGNNWTNIYGPLTPNYMTICRDGTNNTLLYAGISAINYCDPTLTTPTWTSKLAPGTGQISSLAVNPANRLEIWITYGGYIPNNKVYRSLDLGDNWTNESLSLPNIPVYCIAFGNRINNPSGAVYIGTELGVFYIDNTLSDWVPFYNGLPMVPVTDLEVNNTFGKIYASTYGRGIWRSDLYNGCPWDLTLNGSIYGKRFIQAANIIETTQTIPGSLGNELRLRAATRISLKPGFHAYPGSYLKARIGNCDSGVFSKENAPQEHKK